MKLLKYSHLSIPQSLSLLAVIAAVGLFAGCGDDNGVNAPLADQDTTVAEVDVDFSEEHQTIRGFGGATVARWSFTLSEEDLDRVFGNGENQLGFTIHRIQVISDQSPSARDRELQHAQGAKERGAKIIAAPWSPPVRMKTNNDVEGGSLKSDSFAVYAEYLNDFATYMADNDAELYGISLQNEPDIDVNYDSCNWTPNQMKKFLKNHGDKITETRVMAPESYNFNHGFSDSILRDEEAASNVDIVAGHIYGGGLQDYPMAREMGKELWMTEHYVEFNEEEETTTWELDLPTAKEIHDALAEANFSAYVWWYVKRYYGPLQENGEISKRGYLMAQYSKFVRPGYHRVGVSEGSYTDEVHVSAYDGDKAVIVALNLGDTPVKINPTLQNREVTQMTPYRTTENQNLSQRGAVSVSDGSFTYTLPPESVTTFEEN